jgi:hypothetical protein
MTSQTVCGLEPLAGKEKRVCYVGYVRVKVDAGGAVVVGTTQVIAGKNGVFAVLPLMIL